MAVLDDDELDVRKTPQKVDRNRAGFLREVNAGMHPEYKPFQYTKDSQTLNKPKRINIEAESALDAPEGSRRFVDFGENNEKNRNRLFSGTDRGLTPAQAASYLGSNALADGKFTSNLDIGVMNYNMPLDPLHGRVRMLNPAQLRGKAEDWGVLPPKPVNPTKQKNAPAMSPTDRDSRYMLPAYSQMGDDSVTGIAANLSGIGASLRYPTLSGEMPVGSGSVENSPTNSDILQPTQTPFAMKSGFRNTSGIKAFDIFENKAPKPENLSKTPTMDKLANTFRGKTGSGRINQTLKSIGNAGKLTEKFSRSPVGRLALAGTAVGLVSDVYDKLADNSINIKGVRTLARNEYGAAVGEEKSINVNRETVKEFNTMLQDLGTLEANKDLKDTFEQMPNGEGRTTTQRYSGASAIKQFLTYANRPNFDAADDPQLAGFIAQSLEVYKNSKSSTNKSKKSMTETGQLINSLAKSFVDARKLQKKREWQAWADARSKDSTSKKLVNSVSGSFGLSGILPLGTEWVNPTTKEIMYGTPEADPILERNLFAQ